MKSKIYKVSIFAAVANIVFLTSCNKQDEQGLGMKILVKKKVFKWKIKKKYSPLETILEEPEEELEEIVPSIPQQTDKPKQDFNNNDASEALPDCYIE